MNELEKKELEKLNDNRILLEAIEKVFMSMLDFDEFDDDMPNNLLGESLKAKLEARKIIKNGFKEIENYKRSELKKEEINPAL